jgi:hypothetical protein
VQKRFDLAPTSLRFHNAMSSKTCPGSAIDYDLVVREVTDLRTRLDQQPRGAARSIDFPFADQARGIKRVISDLNTPFRAAGDEGEACEHDRAQEIEFSRTTVEAPDGSRAAARGELPPEVLNKLRPHVINLNQGRFSSSGQFQTSVGDLDAIFEEHLANWARSRAGKKLPIVFYAHGGLKSEQSGLLTAQEQVAWWLENGAYPIHFVWETGFLDTLAQILNPNRQRAIDFAAPSDFLIETLARTIGGIKIWGGMKASAEHASDAEGGARYAAAKLAKFCAVPEFRDRIELHAIGHSAGAIFHSHFIPAVLEEGDLPLRSLHLLAPAVRVDTFERQLLPLIGGGKGIEHLGIFTMARDFELADTCAGLYRKSLLYLIYYGLEPDRKTPILGLEESIRGSAALKALLNLDGRGRGAGEVVWAKTKATIGRSASTSVTHGGFDNDAPTMESVAQRILDANVTPFPATETRGLDAFQTLIAQEPALAAFLRPGSSTFTPFVLPTSGAAAPVAAASTGAFGGPVGATAGGRRRALCVGIDLYAGNAQLAGCVNDAREWRRTFLQLGFEEPVMLIDREATRGSIIDTLSDLIRNARAGDVVAFQFAGHGTQVHDLDGDEKSGDSPDQDEAMCPVDFDSGRLIIDDDLATLFDGIPPGVNVTVFADCCHSGSNTRLAIGKPPALRAVGDVRRRFIAATPALQEAHAAFRRSLGASRAAPGPRPYEKAREVLFAACRSREVALESNGHGHFTMHATQLLASGTQGLTNAAFEARVVQAFGSGAGQNPELHCADGLRLQPLLGAAAAPTAVGAGGSRAVGAPDPLRADLARALEAAAQILRG